MLDNYWCRCEKFLLLVINSIVMGLKKHIPNTITLLNLTSGAVSVYFGVKGSPEDLAMAGVFIFIAAVFDFFDGFSARLLHAQSAIGLELDSLSDMVSFGLAPGFILYQMIGMSHGNPLEDVLTVNILPFFAVMVPWMSALRLARFNLDDGQTYSFKGLPTPALAIFVASLPIIRQQMYSNRGLFYMLITNTYFLLGIAILGALLLVSSFPMFSLKFKSLALGENLFKYIFLGISIVLIVFLQITAIPFILLLYLFLSLVIYLTDLQ